MTYQYDAFISYRRVDGSAAAAALRHKLLDYRLPRGFQQHNTLATIGGRDVSVWDWRSGRRQSHLRVADGVNLWSLAFHPNQPVLALGDDRGMVHLWPFRVLPASTRTYAALAAPGRVTRAVSVAISGIVVTGFEDGAIVALDEELRPLIGSAFTGHRSAVQDVAFIDHAQFVSAGYGADGSLKGSIDGREYRLPAGTISLAGEESELAIEAAARGVAVANHRFAGAWSLTGTPAIAPRELQLNGHPVKRLLTISIHGGVLVRSWRLI